jgi:hypothetical protein
MLNLMLLVAMNVLQSPSIVSDSLHFAMVKREKGI